MKKLLYYILYRYHWFLLYYKQWLKSVGGIKGFAEQYLSHFLEDALKKSRRLSRKIGRLRIKKADYIKESLELLRKICTPDEFSVLKKKVPMNGLFLVLLTMGETNLTFINMQVITGRSQNLFDGTMKFLLAFIITFGILWAAKRAIEEFMELFVDKEKSNGNKLPFIVWLCILVGVEALSFYFAKIRAKDFEGGGETGPAGIALIIFSLLLPIIGGFLAYEYFKYLGTYKNTKRMNKISQKIVRIDQRLSNHELEEEHHFLRRCNDRYAVIQEFMTYKGNYNTKHGIPNETLTGHFCATRESFYQKAKHEYQKRLKETLNIIAFPNPKSTTSDRLLSDYYISKT
jgi:hypothetical protein